MGGDGGQAGDSILQNKFGTKRAKLQNLERKSCRKITGIPIGALQIENE